MSKKIKGTLATLALSLSLVSTAVKGQEPNCDDWASSEFGLAKNFWETATVETVMSEERGLSRAGGFRSLRA